MAGWDRRNETVLSNLVWLVPGPEFSILVEGFTDMPWVCPAFCISDSYACLI